MSYIFTWQSWFSDAKRKSVRERERGKERGRRGEGEKKREEAGSMKKRLPRLVSWPWNGSVEPGVGGGFGGCMQIRNTCRSLPSQHTRLWNEGTESFSCCLRTGQAWDGEDDVEIEPAPVSSHPILGERGEDGSNGWLYGSTLGLWKVLRAPGWREAL